MVEPELTEIARTRHNLLSYLDERGRSAGAPADASEIARALERSKDFTEDMMRVGTQLGRLAE